MNGTATARRGARARRAGPRRGGRLLLGAAVAAWLVAAGAGDVEADFDRALAAFESASGTNDTTHPGYVESYAIWSRLAGEGHQPSKYHLGILHYFGLGGAKFDWQTGVGYVREAAESGYPQAQSLMGYWIETSDGTYVESGDARALAWYRKGAESNHCPSVRRLARAYGEGELGLAPDAEEAGRWSARVAGCVKR